METEQKRGPGRPPLDPALRRSESVSASLTPSEAERFKAKAQALGKSPTALAREVLLAILACVALAFGSSGCGGAQSPHHQARDTQIVAISVTGSILGMVSSEIQTLAQADADRTCGTVSSPDADPATCLEQVAARWAPADAATDTAHAALDAWLASIDESPVAAVQATIEAYEAMARALAGFGIKVPPMPEEVKVVLLGLAGGAEYLRGALAPDAGVDAGPA